MVSPKVDDTVERAAAVAAEEGQVQGPCSATREVLSHGRQQERALVSREPWENSARVFEGGRAHHGEAAGGHGKGWSSERRLEVRAPWQACCRGASSCSREGRPWEMGRAPGQGGEGAEQGRMWDREQGAATSAMAEGREKTPAEEGDEGGRGARVSEPLGWTRRPTERRKLSKKYPRSSANERSGTTWTPWICFESVEIATDMGLR